MLNRYFLFTLLMVLVIACQSGKKLTDSPMGPVEPTIEANLDTLTITPEAEENIDQSAADNFVLPPYNPSYSLTNDLIHTKLDIKFDWQKQHVLGLAELTLKPFFYPTNQLELDAKGFDIHHVQMKNTSLKYQYDGNKLTVDLDRYYGSDELYVISIDYTAKPNEVEEGGSAAITSDKGLYFINPLGTENKPQQIWTQGETESSSKWFPTIDKPNERCTQEITLTVQDRFKTLSNGLLVSSTDLGNGFRSDYWQMDKPHAPYLFMVAVGDFAVVMDTSQNIPLAYYVEPEYEADAEAIFNHTPEMIEFFSRITGIPFPWSKYGQIIVRDYVSGAMENTTAVIFGDFVQKTTRELIDNDNDFIVAHELFHHWFGDLVTCESWANLTMNEGFANYSEYLWAEYKYGREQADYHRQNEKATYLNETQMGRIHPLIHFEYDDRESMFDAHSYNKGGMVLHMLRRYIGDDAFFAGLKKYLTDHAFSSTEAHDLRLTFEDLLGKDLNWFFNQWYFSPGHPVLSIEKTHYPDSGILSFTLKQIQDPKTNLSIFQLPITIELFDNNGNSKRHEVWMDQREQRFDIPVNGLPALTLIDPDDNLLMIKMEDKSIEESAFQYRFAEALAHRIEALQSLSGQHEGLAQNILVKALEDTHWFIRQQAITNVDITNNSFGLKQIKSMALNDSHSAVRSAAILKLSKSENKEFIPLLKQVLDQDQAYGSIGAALIGLQKLDSALAFEFATKFINEKPLAIPVGQVLAGSGDLEYLPYFKQQIDNSTSFNVISAIENYYLLIKKQSHEFLSQEIEEIKQWAINQKESIFKRYGSTKALYDLKTYLATARKNNPPLSAVYDEVKVMIKEIKETETNKQLINAYMFFN